MKAPPEIEEQGLRAYEQAGAFERLRRKRTLIISYALCPAALLGLGGVAGGLGHGTLAYACLAGAIGLALVMSWNWRRLQARHAQNLLLLATLEKQYGEDLPWLEVERHLAAMERLVADLDQEKSGRTYIELGPDDAEKSDKE